MTNGGEGSQCCRDGEAKLRKAPCQPLAPALSDKAREERDEGLQEAELDDAHVFPKQSAPDVFLRVFASSSARNPMLEHISVRHGVDAKSMG